MVHQAYKPLDQVSRVHWDPTSVGSLLRPEIWPGGPSGPERGFIHELRRRKRDLYTSGGSGYDKTEYYDLFRQFGIK